jgi:hypothetical protein
MTVANDFTVAHRQATPRKIDEWITSKIKIAYKKKQWRPPSKKEERRKKKI